jgi:hypothetical protein
MATVVSNVQEALKYVYGVNKLLYLFNQESPTFNILGRVKKPVGGRGQFIMPIVVRNPGAWSGITEGGTLPTALTPDTTEATFSLQEYVGMYDISWKLIQDARNDKFAFQQAIQFMEDGIRRRILRNMNSDLIGTGAGELATLTGTDSTGLFTSAYLPRLEKGMRVDIIDLSDDTTTLTGGDDVYVQAVDPIARTVLVGNADDGAGDAITGEAAGDYAVVMNTVGATFSYHTNGLLGVIDDANPKTTVGNYGGVNRSTAGNEFWKSVVLSNSGTNRPLTEDLLLQAMDGVREKGGGAVKCWMSNLPIVRRYHEILAAERFFSLSSPQAIGGGIGRKSMGADSKEGETPYEFSGIPWKVDPYFTNNIIVGLDTNKFYLGVGENETPRPISEIFQDVPFFRQTTSATFEVAWYYQCELLSDNPAAGCKIEDVAEA